MHFLHMLRRMAQYAPLNMIRFKWQQIFCWKRIVSYVKRNKNYRIDKFKLGKGIRGEIKIFTFVDINIHFRLSVYEGIRESLKFEF